MIIVEKNLSFLLSLLLISGFGMSSAFAHTTIHIEQYEIEAGWGDEPPVVNLPNKIVIEVRRIWMKEKAKNRSAKFSAFKSIYKQL